MIREDEPPRPSARVSSLQPEALSMASQRRGTDPRRISVALHGELDWIVMKSLEKDRGRRYESASAFATDVRRYLDDEPVLAGPPSTMYKFHKFARKHRAALATAVAITASLILGTTASVWQAVQATTAEAQANANEQKAVANAAAAQEKEREAIKQRDEVKSLNDTLQRTFDAAHMNLAHNAFEAGGVGRALELLEQHRPKAGESDFRGFEWYYLCRLCHPELLTIKDAGDSRNQVRQKQEQPAELGRKAAGFQVELANVGQDRTSFCGSLVVEASWKFGETVLPQELGNRRWAERLALVGECAADVVDGEVLLPERDDLFLQPYLLGGRAGPSYRRECLGSEFKWNFSIPFCERTPRNA